MDRDGGNCVGERRWSGAISVTSYLTAQCFNGQTVDQSAEREDRKAVIRLAGCSQVNSYAMKFICLRHKYGSED